MKESDKKPKPTSDGPSEPNLLAQKPDLVARMHEERAAFAQFRAQYAQFKSGYNARLYEFFQFVYEIDEAFLNDLDEMRRMISDEFFGSNRQKPDETNLLRHLLYFLADARTEKEREKWLKPAAVLEALRGQGVPSGDVARHLKEAGGYNGIYKSLHGTKSTNDALSDDLDIFDRDQPETGTHASLREDPSQSDVVEAANGDGNGPNALLLTPTPDSNTNHAVDGDAAASNRPAASAGCAIAKAANDSDEAVSGAAQAGEANAGPIRRNRSNTLFVTMQPFQIEMALVPKRGLIFYETKPPVQGTLIEVVAFNVLPWDDDSAPWPNRIDRRELARLRGLDGVSAPNCQAGQAGPANGGLPADQRTSDRQPVPTIRETAPGTVQGRGPNVPTVAPTPSASATVRPPFQSSPATDDAGRPHAPVRCERAGTEAAQNPLPPDKTVRLKQPEGGERLPRDFVSPRWPEDRDFSPEGVQS